MKIIITSPTLALVIASAQEYTELLKPVVIVSGMTYLILNMIFY